VFVLLKAGKQGNGCLFDGHIHVAHRAEGKQIGHQIHRILTHDWTPFEVSITSSVQIYMCFCKDSVINSNFMSVYWFNFSFITWGQSSGLMGCDAV